MNSLERLTAKMMQHPTTQVMVAMVEHAQPKTLANVYGKLITHGDYQSHCRALAIEFELRNRAVVYFHHRRVLEALSEMESALNERKRAHNAILAAGPEVES